MRVFTVGDELIQAHPHPAFDKIRGRGYQVWYRAEVDDECPSFRDLSVQVRRGDEVIGEADFTNSDLELHCQNVKTVTAFQRQGVATAMYMFAEAFFGRSLWNFWSRDPFQSADAQKLWANPDRPFGHCPPRST